MACRVVYDDAAVSRFIKPSMNPDIAISAGPSPAQRVFGDTLAGHVARNFFTHSGHVPVTLLILEFLLAPPGYFSGPDAYVLLAAGIGQALSMGWAEYRGKVNGFLFNLLGPFLYSLAEGLLEGGEFFLQGHHQAYWLFALSFALVHWLQRAHPRSAAALVIAENVVRASIPLVMYALFEARAERRAISVAHFMEDEAHVFLAVVLLLLGLLLGFADLGRRRSLDTIRSLAMRLHEYSAWTMGRGILERAIEDESALALHRIERSILFMDIRGFTAWSETQPPESVVSMLNAYYLVSERALSPFAPIKLKYTADEVMAVFASADAAVSAGRALLAAAGTLLAGHGLGAGVGIHRGAVVEGVLGGEQSRNYDFIGDAVNTAQRICDAAGEGEMLVSVAAAGADAAVPADCFDISVKGRQQALRVCRMVRRDAERTASLA